MQSRASKAKQAKRQKRARFNEQFVGASSAFNHIFGLCCFANCRASSTAAPPNLLFKRRMPVIQRSVSVALRSIYVLTSLCGRTKNSLRVKQSRGQGSDQPCMVRLRAAHSILHIHIWNDLPAPIGNAPQHLFRGLLCSQDSVAGCYARLVWVCDFNSGGRLPCTRTQKTDLRLDCGKATINPSESAVSDHAVWPKFCQGSLRQPADRGKTQRCRPLHVSH